MARIDPNVKVTLSVLDRLVDEQPGSPADPPMSREQSLRLLKAAIKRDLEWLLNTRRSPEAVESSSSELYRSLFNYGLPDISNLSMLATHDQDRLLWMMENTIAEFEPRIRATRITLEPAGPDSRMLRFQIEGLLEIDPAPERINFDTVLELANREYQVTGG